MIELAEFDTHFQGLRLEEFDTCSHTQGQMKLPEMAEFDNYFLAQEQLKLAERSYMAILDGRRIVVRHIPGNMKSYVTAIIVMIYQLGHSGHQDIRAVDWSTIKWIDTPLLETIDDRNIPNFLRLFNILTKVNKALGCQDDCFDFFQPEIVFDILVERFQKVNWSMVPKN